MANFTIQLADNRKALVTKGTVIKRSIKISQVFLPWKKSTREEKQGYVIKLGNNTEYHFVKTREGNWPPVNPGELMLAVKSKGRWVAMEENEVTLAIKKAIDTYETGEHHLSS